MEKLKGALQDLCHKVRSWVIQLPVGLSEVLWYHTFGSTSLNFRGSDQNLPTDQQLTTQITGRTFPRDPDWDRSTGLRNKVASYKDQYL